MNAGLSHRESDDNYHAVVAQLNERCRIIVCRDGIQWIVQFGKRSGRRMDWRGGSYCRTKKALMRVCAQSLTSASPSARAIIEALPERIEA